MLPRWKQTESSGQWLHVQVEMTGVLQDSAMELELFNVFLNDPESGIKHTPSTFTADRKLSHTGDTSKGRGHPEGPGQA